MGPGMGYRREAEKNKRETSWDNLQEQKGRHKCWVKDHQVQIPGLLGHQQMPRSHSQTSPVKSSGRETLQEIVFQLHNKNVRPSKCTGLWANNLS